MIYTGTLIGRYTHDFSFESRRAFVEDVKELSGELLKLIRGNTTVDIPEPVFALVALWDLIKQMITSIRVQIESRQQNIDDLLPPNWTICRQDVCRNTRQL